MAKRPIENNLFGPDPEDQERINAARARQMAWKGQLRQRPMTEEEWAEWRVKVEEEGRRRRQYEEAKNKES